MYYSFGFVAQSATESVPEVYMVSDEVDVSPEEPPLVKVAVETPPEVNVNVENLEVIVTCK